MPCRKDHCTGRNPRGDQSTVTGQALSILPKHRSSGTTGPGRASTLESADRNRDPMSPQCPLRGSGGETAKKV